MPDEGSQFEQKSIRYVLGKHQDVDSLACDCVGFANARGGSIVVGMEDENDEPPANQTIADDLPGKLEKRITQITVNVGVRCEKRTADNGGELVVVQVYPNQQSIAAMSDGRYFMRISDETRRLMPDDLGRLVADRNTFVWELQTTRRVLRNSRDDAKLTEFVTRIRGSDRVSAFVKRKSNDQLLDHYLMAQGNLLTNLGILWVGRRNDRAGLLYSPVAQCIRFDDQQKKIWKAAWTDYSLNPMDLIEAIWREVPDWRESYELPDGLFRKNVPHYDEVVVRELLANALVHRPYTQRGDVFINLFPDRLEVHNPGLLPIGVTPKNILHTSMQRNRHLAQVFIDLKLMEAEGSGFDRMFDVLLSTGRAAPEVMEGDDRVVVTVRKRIINPAIVDFLAKADQELQLSQRERIALGVLAQHETMTSLQLSAALELKDADNVKVWTGRLVKLGIMKSNGRTKGTTYFIDPTVLRKLKFKGTTSLKGIEQHRLRELIRKDLEIYGEAKISEIHARIGSEIPRRRLERELPLMAKAGLIGRRGDRKTTTYFYPPSGGESGRVGGKTVANKSRNQS